MSYFPCGYCSLAVTETEMGAMWASDSEIGFACLPCAVLKRIEARQKERDSGVYRRSQIPGAEPKKTAG